MKKFLALVLAAAMLLPFAVVEISAADIWDGTVAASFASGSGTETDPYVIKTGAQLAYLAEQVATQAKGTYAGKYFALGGDINLNHVEWRPIGGNGSDFDGNFDGRGYTVSGVKISNTAQNKFAGLFGVVRGNTYLKNLVIADSEIDASTISNSCAGAVAGYIDVDEISSIAVKSDVSVSAGDSAGGVFGRITGGTLTYIVNNASVTVGGAYAGGISGTLSGGGTLSYSVNHGNVTGSINGYYGGIVGLIGVNNNKSGGTVIEGGSVKNSYNDADISGTGAKPFIGGITGRISDNSAPASWAYCLENVYNIGAVDSPQVGSGTGVVDTIRVGEITGQIHRGSMDLTNCYSVDVDNVVLIGFTRGTTYDLSTVLNKSETEIRALANAIDAAIAKHITYDMPAGVSRPTLSNFVRTNTYDDGRFSDVRASDWFAANVASVYAYGLMNGNSATTFNPTGNITVAETVTLLARIHATYTGKTIDTASASPWYQPYVNYARDAGLLTESFADYGAVISRADFARLLALAVDERDLEKKNSVEDGAIPDVKMDDRHASAVYLLYRAGILTGSDEKGTFNPATGISRAEAAALVTRIIDPTLRKSVTLKSSTKLNTITNVESTKITLKNIFANDMLIQQNKPFSITGTYKAAVGDYRAELYLGDKLVESVPVVLDPIEGTFQADFSAVKGSYDKYTIRIMGGSYKVAELKNVLFGELWIASGQSNMAYTLSKDQDYPKSFVKDEFIRVMKVSRPVTGYSKTPLAENPTTAWVVGTNQSGMESVTAVGYYFARNLREELDVPVGLIFYAIGATKICSWISRETIDANPVLTTTSVLAKRYKPLTTWDTSGNKQATALYNTMVAPSLGLNAAGLIWYQGESDLGDRTGYYAKELEIMHKQYSRLYGYGDAEMPFIMASIMPYLMDADPHYYGTMSADIAAYAASCDKVAAVWLGGLSPEHDDTNSASHPHEKLPVGRRLADSAMAMVYSEKYDADGPIAVSSTVSGNTMTLTFSNVADGLCIADGSSVLRGFKICGADGVYYPANAKIVGKDKVEVSSPNVDKPISAAYAYELNIYTFNLGCTYGGELLFMGSPFVLNKPEKATFIPTISYDDCDLPSIWHLTNSGGHYACEYDTWIAEQNKQVLTVSFDRADKAQGDAALKVTVPVAGEVVVKPALAGSGKNGSSTLFTDTINDYSYFRQLTVKIKNDTDQPLTVNSFRISGGYAMPSVNTIPARSGWVEVTYDLKTLYTASGAVAGNVSLTKVSAMQFSFTAGGAGSIGVDDLQFLTAEVTAAPATP